jgi:hypothetical protein
MEEMIYFAIAMVFLGVVIVGPIVVAMYNGDTKAGG